VIERHSEPDGDEEVYIVVRGRVRFTIGEETFEPGPATVVYGRQIRREKPLPSNQRRS
jgi:mannose-6-phosphate isomerase-like protein (cupin superfamily)